MADPGFREEIPDNDPRLRLSKTVKKVADLLNRVNFLKEDYGDRPLMAPQGWEPKRTEGLGSLLGIDKLADHLDLSARGFSATYDKQPGMGDKIPQLRSNRKEALSVIADLLPGPGPTEAKLAAGAAAGVIKRKGDNITPQVAKDVASRLLGPGAPTRIGANGRYDSIYDDLNWNLTPEVGPPSRIQDPTLYEELVEKLARHIQKTAGAEGDPMQGARTWGKPIDGWGNNNADAPLEPRGGEAETSLAMESARERGYLAEADPVRQDLPRPTGPAGVAMDEIAATLLGPGLAARRDLEVANNLAQIPPEVRGQLDEFYRRNTGAYIPRGAANEDYVSQIKGRAEGELAESGVNRENLPKVLETMPPGTALGILKKFEEGDVSSLVGDFGDFLASKEVREIYSKIPENKRKNMAFPQIYAHIDNELEKTLREYDQKLVGEVVHKYNDGDSWQRLDKDELLKREGLKQNICVGGSDYCNYVKQGKMDIFSLRDKNNKPGVTMSVNIRGGGEQEIWPTREVVDEIFADPASFDAQWMQQVLPALRAGGEDIQETRRHLKDFLYYTVDLDSETSRRLAGYPNYDPTHVTPQDVERFRNSLAEAARYVGQRPQDYENGDTYLGVKAALEQLGVTFEKQQVPKVYELDQIKGKNNRQPHAWSAEEKARWVPKVQELLESLNVGGVDRKTDGTSFLRTKREMEEAARREIANVGRSRHAEDADMNERMDRWRPEVAHGPGGEDGLQMPEADAINMIENAPQRVVNVPGAIRPNGEAGNQLNILDLGEYDGHAYWYDDNTELVMMAPQFNNGEIDWAAAFPIDEAAEMDEAIRELIRNRVLGG